MLSLMESGGIGLWISLLATPLVMRSLLRRRLGQHIREDGPATHMVKAGTPTMGGLAIVGAVVIGYCMGHVGTEVPFTRSGDLVVLAVLSFGAIGFIDDWIKIRHKRSLGLQKRGKLFAQVAAGVLFAELAVHWAHTSTALSFTRLQTPGIHLGEAGWVVLATVVLVATSNAVNLTDGLDGLAAGSMAIASFAFVILALIAGSGEFAVSGRPLSEYLYLPGIPASDQMAVVGGAMFGACCGFLWFNCNPAQVFMGDTGSLALGGLLGYIALVIRQELLLLVVGGIFVAEAMSVMIQRYYFKYTRLRYGQGRRVFLMAPLHHHFQKKNWTENQIVVRFWLIGAILALIALATVKIR